MKVLLTGARGQVGRALARSRPTEVELIALGRDQLDIGDDEAVAAYIDTAKPDVIINTAAYTAVDRAESEPQIAHRGNAVGPANLARAAARVGARLVHYSTDFVFDGEQSAPYKPDDPTRPLSIYGSSKLAGEVAIRQIAAERAVIIRTSWVYDAVGSNFVRTMLRLMRERGAVRVIADQIGSPTSADSIAQATWRFVANPSQSGTFHWTDAGVASWYDFAVAIYEEARARGLLMTDATVTPISTAEYPTPARRPRFSVLDKQSTSAAIGVAPEHWRVKLRAVLGEMQVA